MKKKISFFFLIFIFTNITFANDQNNSHSDKNTHKKTHKHSLSKKHNHESDKNYFEDSWVKDRKIRDFVGIWRSAYLIVKNNNFQKFLERKAKNENKSLEDIKNYYEKGYKTDIDYITIDKDNVFEFKSEKGIFKNKYEYKGFKILEYSKNSRGVRYLWTATEEIPNTPKFIQISDHNFAPKKSKHFHIFSSNESHEKLLTQLDNWPTYYPGNLMNKQIINNILRH